MTASEPAIDVVVEWIGRAAASRFPDIPVTPGTALIESGMLDSIEILNLVGFLEKRFAFALPVEEFLPENFQTARDIACLVERMRGRPGPMNRQAL